MDSTKHVSQLHGEDAGRRTPPRILDSMTGNDFMLSVTRAEIEAAEAVETLDEMVVWVERLRPYFDFDPEMTVAQALQLYLKDRPRKTPRKHVELADSE